MDFFSPTDRCFWVHPWTTKIPQVGADDALGLAVPESVTDSNSLRSWLRDAYPNVEAIYRPEVSGWCKIQHQACTDPLPPAPWTLHVRLRRPAGPSNPVLTDICREAQNMVAHLRSAYSAPGNLTLANLSNPAKQSIISFMGEEFTMIGRSCIASVVSFIRETTVLKHNFSFVLGSAGSGKTWSVRAASLFLFLDFLSSGQGRLMLVNGHDFSNDPARTLVRSLALAYHDSSRAEYYIQSLKNDKDVEAVINIMWKIVVREEDRRLYIVVDDQGPELSSEHASFLDRISAFAAVVVCGKWKSFIDRALFINGGFKDDEIDHYLALVKAQDPKEKLWWETGWVPKILAVRSSKRYEAFLEEYIEKMPAKDWGRFSQLLAGGLERKFFPEQATGLFYAGDDGQVECISESLRCYAANQFLHLATLRNKTYINELVGMWTTVVERDPGNLARIGLNSELASITVARYKEPVITYKNGSVTIAPTVISLFDGSFTMALANKKDVPTLFIPRHGTEKGLDCYYVTDSYLVFMQMAVGSRAVEDHKHTRPKAEELFLSDDHQDRTHILVWVVYCTSSWFHHHKELDVEGRQLDYHEVFSDFGSFHKDLACIDDKLAKLRKGRYGGEANPRCCICYEQQTADTADYSWMQCHGCQRWYHEVCHTAEDNCRDCFEDAEKRKAKKARKAEAKKAKEEEKAATAALAKKEEADKRSERAKKRKRPSD